MTVQELYESTVRPLPPSDRLRLATLILDGLPVAGSQPIDHKDEWSDEDLADLTAVSLTRADAGEPWDDADA